MNIVKHGLSIGIERVNQDVFLAIKAVGKLTHADYEAISPMINSALSQVKHPEVNVLIDGTELKGWEARAVWDDFRLLLKHNNKFRKVAIYGNKNWQETLSKVGAWFISGEVEYFSDQQEAFNWLNHK
ncbi:MAG: STAS/SEC14 domain-containing protein [Thalassotalea sp.]